MVHLRSFECTSPGFKPGGSAFHMLYCHTRIPRRKEPTLPMRICQAKRFISWWACAAAGPWNNKLTCLEWDTHSSPGAAPKPVKMSAEEEAEVWSTVLQKSLWVFSNEILQAESLFSHTQNQDPLHPVARDCALTLHHLLGLSEYSVASSTGSSSSSLLFDYHRG